MFTWGNRGGQSREGAAEIVVLTGLGKSGDAIQSADSAAPPAPWGRYFVTALTTRYGDERRPQCHRRHSGAGGGQGRIGKDLLDDTYRNHFRRNMLKEGGTPALRRASRKACILPYRPFCAPSTPTCRLRRVVGDGDELPAGGRRWLVAEFYTKPPPRLFVR